LFWIRRTVLDPDRVAMLAAPRMIEWLRITGMNQLGQITFDSE
jgi:hypothetical protein